jgi:hypothetical protein
VIGLYDTGTGTFFFLLKPSFGSYAAKICPIFILFFRDFGVTILLTSFFFLTDLLYGSLASASNGQAILEDKNSRLPVVLAAQISDNSSNIWRPSLVEITQFTIGQEKRKLPDGSAAFVSYLLLHSWRHLDEPAVMPESECFPYRQYRVLAKTAVLSSGECFFVRLLRHDIDNNEEWCADFNDNNGDVLTVRMTDLTLYPWIRPLASRLSFSAAAEEDLFEVDRYGTDLLQRQLRTADKGQRSLVMKQKRSVRCTVADNDEEREEEEERWEKLEEESVAAMPENEDVNIRFAFFVTYLLFTWCLVLNGLVWIS